MFRYLSFSYVLLITVRAAAWSACGLGLGYCGTASNLCARRSQFEDGAPFLNEVPMIRKQQGLHRPVFKRPQSPNNLRIVGGTLKGRNLEAPRVHLRPMMSKVRMALYNSIASILEVNTLRGMKVLDMYAGSGCVGLEALSREADHATFVDLSLYCIKTCRENIISCGFGLDDGKASTIVGDAELFLNTPQKFGVPQNRTYDLLIFSPPYREISFSSLFKSIVNSPLLSHNSLVAVEYPKEVGAMPGVMASQEGLMLHGLRNRNYGRTWLALFVFEPTRTFYPNRDEFTIHPEYLIHAPK